MEELDYEYLVVIVVGLFYDPGGYVSPCKLHRFERGYERESSHIGIFCSRCATRPKPKLWLSDVYLTQGFGERGKERR